MQDNRTIRHATLNDIDDIMAVLAVAREKMRRSGNANQWINGYPTEQAVIADIECNGGLVVEECGNIVAYFAFLPSPEPTYACIYDKPQHRSWHFQRRGGLLLLMRHELAHRYPPRQQDNAKPPSRAWLPLLWHHLPAGRRRTSRLPAPYN